MMCSKINTAGCIKLKENSSFVRLSESKTNVTVACQSSSKMQIFHKYTTSLHTSILLSKKVYFEN